eukprot:m.129339 g.129339  ORF g.129339 m.129339 type:complete len:74 (-) comp13671_c0_seq2:4152-4373(-)
MLPVTSTELPTAPLQPPTSVHILVSKSDFLGLGQAPDKSLLPTLSGRPRYFRLSTFVLASDCAMPHLAAPHKC